MATFEELKKVQTSYEADLLSKTGVHGVGIGYKTVAGKPTDQLSIVVLVDDKLAPDELSAEDMIPPDIAGVATDVVEHGRFERATGMLAASEIDNSQRRPLVGGCAISADPPPVTPPPGRFWAGTLGGFAQTIPDPPMFPWSVGVSCYHVLGPLVGHKGSNVLQQAGGPQVSQVTASVRDPEMGVDASGFAGLIQGTSYKNSILGYGTVTGSHPVDSSDLYKTVFKSGIASGQTNGVLRFLNVSALVDGVLWKHQLLVDGAFADHGDSGSFVLLPDPSGQGLYLVIGLLMGKVDGDGPQAGIANLIGNVETALGIQFPAPAVG
jgi:hypothetical protein